MSAAETLSFQAETQELLDLMVHSLYSHREIFLRELISNASDALDKRRFEGLTETSIREGQGDPAIRIEVDREARCLTLSDNGIGMSREEVISNLGTIARSGTRKFLEQAGDSADGEAPDLIGQFGVGFYSCFMVADEVVVETLRAGESEGVRWRSKGDGNYELEPCAPEAAGTRITLHLKGREEEDEAFQEFSDPHVLRSLVKKYSDFVEYPIEMPTVLLSPPKAEGDDDEAEEDRPEWTVLNSRKPLWARPKDEITPEEHQEFYRHISHDWNEPFETVHFKVEGTTEYTSLLYIPSQPPFDLFEPKREGSRVSLYVRRVFVMQDCEDLMPPWLRFVRGVVDSQDLPLNVSREILQQNRVVGQIKKRCTRKVIDALANVLANDRERYLGFWKSFGAVLKEGVIMEAELRETVADLCLFETTREGGPWTLPEIVERMPEDQDALYFLAGEGLETLKSSPHLESLRARGYEVILLTDPVDDWLTQHMPTYREKPLRAIDRGEVDLESDEQKSEREKLQEDHKGLLAALEIALEDEVESVRFSSRLTDSAAVLVDSENAPGQHMERFLKQSGRDVPQRKRVLELNGDHELLQRLQGLYDQDAASDTLREHAELLYGQALLTEGSPLPDPKRFAELLTQLMIRG